MTQRRILKQELRITDLQVIHLQSFTEILSIQIQNNIPCIWYLCYPDNLLQEITFEIFGTGHYIEDNIERKFIGTFQIDNGKYVFHLFQRI